MQHWLISRIATFIITLLIQVFVVESSLFALAAPQD